MDVARPPNRPSIALSCARAPSRSPRAMAASTSDTLEASSRWIRSLHRTSSAASIAAFCSSAVSAWSGDGRSRDSWPCAHARDRCVPAKQLRMSPRDRPLRRGGELHRLGPRLSGRRLQAEHHRLPPRGRAVRRRGEVHRHQHAVSSRPVPAQHRLLRRRAVLHSRRPLHWYGPGPLRRHHEELQRRQRLLDGRPTRSPPPAITPAACRPARVR